MSIKEYLNQAPQQFIPQLSVDIATIGYQDGLLKCLLLNFKDKWMLPGGFVFQTESVEDAAYRVLSERSGITNAHLQFLQVFGDKERNFYSEYEKYFQAEELETATYKWFNHRFVTLSYYALIDIEKSEPKVGPMDSAWGWFSIDDLPSMMMDHQDIVMSARERLQRDIKSEVISYNLLTEEFTMPELHQLHQVILGEPIDRSRFQKKMLSSGRFERLPQAQKERPGRNPYLYRIKK